MDVPVGFRFLPTDEELVEYYLTNKVFFKPLPANVIRDIHASDFYTNHPRHLGKCSCMPAHQTLNFRSRCWAGLVAAVSSTRESEYFFFIGGDDSAEEVRTVEGEGGSWKSSGDETPIYDSDGNIFAFKIYWACFTGSPRKPKKTHWRME